MELNWFGAVKCVRRDKGSENHCYSNSCKQKITRNYFNKFGPAIKLPQITLDTSTQLAIQRKYPFLFRIKAHDI